MTEKDIKPIPKYIREKIRKLDLQKYPNPMGHVRFYAYLTYAHKELIKITVAVKHRYKTWYCKQVAAHGVNTPDRCFVRDMAYTPIAGYLVGWYEEGASKTAKWYEDGEWGWYDRETFFDPYCTVINPEVALKAKEFQYSAADKIDFPDIIGYLRMYREYPQAEYLVKAGLTKYAMSIQILRKMGKDKKFCKWLSKNRDELKAHCYISTVLSAYRKGRSVHAEQIYEETRKSFQRSPRYKTVKELFGGDLERFFTYIAEQNTNTASYGDYLDACQYLGVDLSKPKNLIPHDFKRWHDIRIDEYKSKKAEADERARKEFYERFLAVAEKYVKLEGGNTGFAVILAKSPAELVKEGDLLHHCVGRMGYDQKVVREESLIFFIRRADDLDTPLATLEYSLKSKKILQCYGDHDSRPEQALLDYIQKKWLPRANRQMKKLQAAA